MPGKMQVLNIVVIALQYSLVILLYYFLYRVVRLAARELNTLAAYDPSLLRYDADTPARSQPARLVVISDQQSLLAQTSFSIDESLIIGRSQHNDVTINDSFISHEHACISRSKHNFLLADLNSTNGTLLNGRRIEEETALVNGDIIQIGAVTFKFER